jgi:chemotaxis protein MotA
MDPSALIGVGLALAGLATAMTIEGTHVPQILLPAPLILVFLVSFAVTTAGSVTGDVTGLAAQLRKALLGRRPANPRRLLETLVGLAEKARRDGLLGLENALAEVEDPFLKEGLQRAIDGIGAEELSEILEGQLAAKHQADRAGARTFSAMGGYAPTIGIIGTVIGLVHVLSDLAQPDTLGRLIASAFVATLWGILSANVIWLPISNRLKRLSDLECDQMELVIVGILYIQAGTNPRILAQRLSCLLPPDTPTGRQTA